MNAKDPVDFEEALSRAILKGDVKTEDDEE